MSRSSDIHSACTLTGRTRLARLGLAIVPLALCFVACSARFDSEVGGRTDESCSALAASVPIESAPNDTRGFVWLVNNGTEQPLVLNWQHARINGEAAQLFEHRGRTWLVSQAHAFRADWVGPDVIEGKWLRCAESKAESDYVAVPLAPIEGQTFGLTEVARVPAVQDPSREPTLDLALQRPGLVVVAQGADGVRWLESSPERGRLAEVGRLPALIQDTYNDVAAINERYVAVASNSRGLIIVDATEPTSPRVVVDSLPELLPKHGHSVFVNGSRLYLAQAPPVGTGAVVAFDVTEPEAPRQLWRWKAEPGHDAHDITVRGDRLYVSSIRGGMTLLDAAGDDAPRVVARRMGLGAHSCSLVDAVRANGPLERLLWEEERLGGSLHLVDVVRSNRGVELEVSRLSGRGPDDTAGALTTRFAASPHHSQCDRELCFVAHYQLGLQVLDAGGATGVGFGPTEASIVAAYPTWQPTVRGEQLWLKGAVGVALDLPWVYVADTEAGVIVLRYDAASAPTTDKR